MRDKDAAKFGAIVEGLVGSACEPILATNSIKFIFDVDEDPRGRAYIWIDPPWGLFRDAAEVTSSAVYSDAPDDYANWRTLFRPLDGAVLEQWREDRSGGSIFEFAGYRLVVPHLNESPFEDAWYIHWYATLTDVPS